MTTWYHSIRTTPSNLSFFASLNSDFFFCGCRDVVQKYPSPVGSTNIGYDYSISLESRYFYTISCQIFHFFFIVNRLFGKLYFLTVV